MKIFVLFELKDKGKEHHFYFLKYCDILSNRERFLNKAFPRSSRDPGITCYLIEWCRSYIHCSKQNFLPLPPPGADGFSVFFLCFLVDLWWFHSVAKTGVKIGTWPFLLIRLFFFFVCVLSKRQEGTKLHVNSGKYSFFFKTENYGVYSLMSSTSPKLRAGVASSQHPRAAIRKPSRNGRRACSRSCESVNGREEHNSPGRWFLCLTQYISFLSPVFQGGNRTWPCE